MSCGQFCLFFDVQFYLLISCRQFCIFCLVRLPLERLNIFFKILFALTYFDAERSALKLGRHFIDEETKWLVKSTWLTNQSTEIRISNKRTPVLFTGYSKPWKSKSWWATSVLRRTVGCFAPWDISKDKWWTGRPAKLSHAFVIRTISFQAIPPPF